MVIDLIDEGLDIVIDRLRRITFFTDLIADAIVSGAAPLERNAPVFSDGQEQRGIQLLIGWIVRDQLGDKIKLIIVSCKRMPI